MMIPAKIQLVISYAMIIGVEYFVETTAQIRYPSYGNQSQSNIREIYHTPYFDRDNPRESRSSTDIPVSFKAPDVRSENFWNYYITNSSNRRTFTTNLPYFDYGKANIFPNLNSFFEFMNPLFDKGNIFKPTPPTVPKSISEPYRYEYPYVLRQTTDRNFLPPPKPIRASIVKLETVTQSPGPFDYANPTDNLPRFSQFKPIPTNKPISLHIDELGFHSIHNMNFKSEPGWDAEPEEFPTPPFMDVTNSTVYIPSSAEVYQQSIRVIPSTEQEYLIRDKLNNDTNKQVLTSKEKIIPQEEAGNISFTVNGSVNEESEKNFEHIVEHKNGELDKNSSGNMIELFKNSTLFNQDDSKSDNVSNVEGTSSIRSLRPYGRGNSIKIVTELTLEGLSKNNKQTANIPGYAKYINMSGLINYELNKLKQNKVMTPRSDEAEEEESPSLAVRNRSFTDPNTSEELSLDLKILKDTNWDGFTTEFGPKADPNSTEKDDNIGKSIINTDISIPLSSNETNNSQTNYTKYEKLEGNKTIIVETRITKSVTKALPISNRRIYKKLRGSNRSSVPPRNVINRTSSISNSPTNQTSTIADLKSETVPEVNKEKDYKPSEFTIRYNASNDSENTKMINETTAIVEKYLNSSKENETIDNSRRFNFTHRSPSGIYEKIAKRPYISLDNINEETLNITTIGEIKENLDLVNYCCNPQKNDTSNIMTIRKKPRKRKRKRGQKLRRRTGKGRQNNIATTQETNSTLINTTFTS